MNLELSYLGLIPRFDLFVVPLSVAGCSCSGIVVDDDADGTIAKGLNSRLG